MLRLLTSRVVMTVVLLTGAAQAQQPPAPKVTVSEPLRKVIVEHDEYTGQFAATQSVDLRARVSGYLTEIHFRDGQLVKDGDLLFVIDPRPYAIALQSAEASLAQAEANVQLAQRQLGRTAELRQRDFAPASQYDQRVAELRVAQANVEGARASVNSAKLNLEFTRITAPFSGRIGRHQVDIGNLVTAGESGQSTVLTSIVTQDPIDFYYDLSENNFLEYQRASREGRLAPTRDGDIAVEVRLSDEDGWPHRGKLDFVDNQVDRASGTIRLRARFPNPDNALTPGQFGRIRMPGSAPYEAILVPDAAVITDQSRKVVLVVGPDGLVAQKPVRPGPVVDGLRVIRSGLEANDRVIIEGTIRARPGSKVTPEPGRIETAETAG